MVIRLQAARNRKHPFFFSPITLAGSSRESNNDLSRSPFPIYANTLPSSSLGITTLITLDVTLNGRCDGMSGLPFDLGEV